MARELIGSEHFLEVYVSTPLEVCEQRDPKGLYKKARSGLLPNLSGIGSVYEPPINPDLSINAIDGQRTRELTESVMTWLDTGAVDTASGWEI